MIDTNVVIYDYPHNSYLELVVEDGCFKLISEVRVGDDEYSEVHYSLNKEETSKVLGIVSFEDFVDFVRKEHLKGVLDFFKNNDISFVTTGIF